MLLHIMKDRGTYQRFDLYFSTLVLCRRQSKSKWSKSIIILVPTIDVEMIRGNFLKAEMMGGKKKTKKGGGKPNAMAGMEGYREKRRSMDRMRCTHVEWQKCSVE